jgi:4-hydroxy-2-oxoheptanedioate aldolase
MSNRLRRRLEAGDTALISGNHDSEALVDFTGSLRLFDAVWIDMEYGPVTVAGLPGLARAADLWEMTALVRVPKLEASGIRLVLGQGVHGVIVPHVGTRADAEAVVDAARFPPIGSRVAYGGRLGFGKSPAEARELSNRETLVGVMVEDVRAIENLDQILRVPYIDFYFIGHYDLAQSMGYGVEGHHPEVVKMYDQAVGRIVAEGRPVAAVIGEQELTKYLRMGVRIIKAPSWESWVTSGARAFGKAVSQAAE